MFLFHQNFDFIGRRDHKKKSLHYESLDDMSSPWDILQKPTKKRIRASEG